MTDFSILFTKDYRIKELNYISVGKIGKFEWLAKKSDNGYHVCVINKLDEVEFGTDEFIKNEVYEVITNLNKLI